MNYRKASVQPRQRLYPGVNSSTQYARPHVTHHIHPAIDCSVIRNSSMALSRREPISSSRSCGYVGHACTTIAHVRHTCMDNSGKQS